MPTALITGITGQDGSYLAEFLLEKGYTVHGIIRRSSSFNTGRIEHLYEDPHAADTRLHLHYGDLTDGMSLVRVLETVHPSEIYNLAAQSHVRVSFDQPEYTADVVAMGTLRLLEALRSLGGLVHRTRVYQASSSEMFGGVEAPTAVCDIRVAINERTPFNPRSPYAVSKVFAYYLTRNYREAYRFFVSNGILFNHESPRRGETFVTRKVTRAAARIKLGLQSTLYLGNLDARRDWGYAKEFVEAMWLMLQQDEPDDFIIGTGQQHSVRELCEIAFSFLDLDYRDFVRVDQRYLRPTDVARLLANPAKAKRELGWESRTSFRELVKLMVEADLELARRESRA